MQALESLFVGSKFHGFPFLHNKFVKIFKERRNALVTELMRGKHIADPCASDAAAVDGLLPKRPRTELCDGLPEVGTVVVPAVGDADEIQMRVLTTADLRAPVYFELTAENIEMFRKGVAADYSALVGERPRQRVGIKVTDDAEDHLVYKLEKN